MMGFIESNHAILFLTFRTDTLGEVVAKFVVDTGYAGFLTLPPKDILTLGLTYVEPIQITLADGSAGLVDSYQGVIVWHGNEMLADVLEMDSNPLLGAGLLRGSRLVIDFEESGAVTVTPL